MLDGVHRIELINLHLFLFMDCLPWSGLSVYLLTLFPMVLAHGKLPTVYLRLTLALQYSKCCASALKYWHSMGSPRFEHCAISLFTPKTVCGVRNHLMSFLMFLSFLPSEDEMFTIFGTVIRCCLFLASSSSVQHLGANDVLCCNLFVKTKVFKSFKKFVLLSTNLDTDFDHLKTLGRLFLLYFKMQYAPVTRLTVQFG